ncbi:MAG: type II secretion system protein GspE [Actinobacteria bacterium]|nr:MAG: type II secretion system protein GspE [Actinomycetota bacterium]
MQRPAPISPATSSPTRTRARETRCTTAFMFSARNDDITRVEAAHLPWQHLGSLLINRGLLTVEQVKQAFEEQRLTGRRLGEVAVGHGWVTGADLAKALADQFGVEYVDLSEVEPDRDAATLLQKELAFRYQALPIRFLANDLLLVAVADPTDVGRADDLRLALGHNVRLAVSEPNDLERAIKALYRTQIEVDEETGPDAEDAALEVAAERAEISEAAGETPAVKLVHTTLAQAIEDGASDIHFEPQERELIVRARIDGVTRAVATIPKQMQPAVVTRLKIMGRLDIAERRAPQDGRVSVRFGGEPLDLRVAVIPTTHGEQVVLRILHRAVSKPDLEQLGMTPRVRELFERAIRQPYGAVVVCGPTGSGKTTTLYTALHMLNDPGRVLMTIEDPVEYQIPGVNQIEISPKSGLTFARGLRTILRSDPDVLLVGEIRDEETARIAMQAGMTGHLVLTTLHAHNAAGSVARLKDMGIETGLLASSVNCVVAQRLARRLCTECREPYWPSDEELALLGLLEHKGKVFLHRAKGCGRCGGTGYRGRVALYEVMPVTREVRALLESGTDEIHQAAIREGMTTLHQDGVRLCIQGVSSLEEIHRVAGERR